MRGYGLPGFLMGWMDFAKTGEIKGDTYLHGVRYDNKKFLCFIVIRYLLLKYFVLQYHHNLIPTQSVVRTAIKRYGR